MPILIISGDVVKKSILVKVLPRYLKRQWGYTAKDLLNDLYDPHNDIHSHHHFEVSDYVDQANEFLRSTALSRFKVDCISSFIHLNE